MSREIPYSPMEKRKYVSLERMNEILQRRVSAIPKPISNGSLLWKRVSAVTIQSCCDRFRIDKHAEGFKAYRRGTDRWKFLEKLESADQARATCQKYALEAP